MSSSSESSEWSEWSEWKINPKKRTREEISKGEKWMQRNMQKVSENDKKKIEQEKKQDREFLKGVWSSMDPQEDVLYGDGLPRYKLFDDADGLSEQEEEEDNNKRIKKRRVFIDLTTEK